MGTASMTVCSTRCYLLAFYGLENSPDVLCDQNHEGHEQ